MEWVAALAVALLVLAIGYDASTAAAQEEAGSGEGQSSELLAEVRDIFEPLPEKMPGSENDTENRIALGKKLYFETAISVNRTQSCNSCHRLDEKRGGVDNLPTSEGAEGEFGDRNSPTTLNAGLHIAQFWDGRAADLKEQAKGPVLNPIEMGMANEAAVLARLEEAGYGESFKTAFPGAEPALTYDNYAEAVAAFERTLITRDRFDDYLGGELQALTAAETGGLKEFVEVGCIDCHSGALLGGDSYEKMGQVHEYANKKDLGRFGVTKDEEDKFVFKVPSLRNIALTAPYFHDGQVKTLAEAVKQMAWLQLGEELDESQVASIAAFLGSLTDKERAAK
jgi:cytochrome c peroxidase